MLPTPKAQGGFLDVSRFGYSHLDIFGSYSDTSRPTSLSVAMVHFDLQRYLWHNFLHMHVVWRTLAHANGDFPSIPQPFCSPDRCLVETVDILGHQQPRPCRVTPGEAVQAHGFFPSEKSSEKSVNT